jgi:hypothetical protein
LGWTDDEIGEALGCTKQNVATTFRQAFPDLEKSVKDLLASGIPHLDVAERFNLPLILVHAIDLHGREDQERLKHPRTTSPPA